MSRPGSRSRRRGLRGAALGALLASSLAVRSPAQAGPANVVVLEERGREELLAGSPSRALAYLGEAYRAECRSASLRFLLAAAARSVESLHASLAGPARPTALAFSHDSNNLAVTDGVTATICDVQGKHAPSR